MSESKSKNNELENEMTLDMSYFWYSDVRDMNFKSSYADPDVWMRVAYKGDGTSLYEYVLCYVDDLLCISTDPAVILGCVEQTYQLKEKPCKHECFLGATIKEFYFQGNAKPRWAMS